MNGALDHSDQPDPDAIKMFVGQIPRSWSEKELKELFEPYGAVYQINVLRDRSQNPPQSKGTERGAGVARRPGGRRGALGQPELPACWRAGGRAGGQEGWKQPVLAAPVLQGLLPAPPRTPARRPARPLGQVGGGREGPRQGGSAEARSRRVIAPGRSLSRQRSLCLGGVAASPRNRVSQPCISGPNSSHPYVPRIAHVITIAFRFSIACGDLEVPYTQLMMPLVRGRKGSLEGGTPIPGGQVGTMR